MEEVLESVNAGLLRLAAAASALEGVAARLEQCGEAQSGEVGKITAAIESGSSRREQELERRLAEAEQTLAQLQARGESRLSTRKTLPAATAQLLAKSGIDAGEQINVQSLDEALVGLSVEQRIAVKAQMLRTGTLTL